uniref:Protein kinase domain-containing protein n=1 Tax=Panagrellus redivivus TaxID=6233 RepID=A0A7E4UX52_PANRE
MGDPKERNAGSAPKTPRNNMDESKSNSVAKPRKKGTEKTKSQAVRSKRSKGPDGGESTKSKSESGDSATEKGGTPKKKKNVVEFNHEERKQHKLLTAAERPKLDRGDIVVGMKMKFEVMSLLGSGGFGDVYKVRPSDSNESGPDVAAMKTELQTDNNHPMMNRLKIELEIMRMFEGLPAERKSHFTEMYDRGATPSFKFIVMELVGSSIYNLQKALPKREFSLTTALKLGLQTLAAVDDMHQLGYLHRDIKPHNYSIGVKNKTNVIYMLDFGIARRYVKKGSKVLRVPRETVKFLGTLKYASRSCHHSKEQSRKDDLESWFYMMLEFVDFHSVFWGMIKDRRQVIQAKEKMFAGECNNKLENIPPEVFKIMLYLDGLTFTSAPDYEYIKALLSQCAKVNEVQLADAFDWEDNAPKKKKRYKKKKRFGLFGGPDEKALLYKERCKDNGGESKVAVTAISMKEATTSKSPANNDKDKDTDE